MSVAWTEPIDWAVCRPDEQASSDKGHQAETKANSSCLRAVGSASRCRSIRFGT